MASPIPEELAADIQRQDAAFAEAFAELEAMDPATVVAVPDELFDGPAASNVAARPAHTDWSRRA